METLYNGIVLPDVWPPRAVTLPVDPVTPPYLLAPPDVIPVDLGRQLFVDDFLVERTDLRRTFHLPEQWEGNPVMKPDRPWECSGNINAMPFSDGVWFDPAEGLYKMWYYGGGGDTVFTCYAVSRDGLQWEKPSLGVAAWQGQSHTNIVAAGERDSGAVWLDHEDSDPAGRFKMTLRFKKSVCPHGLMHLYRSGDGLRWEHVSDGAPVADRSTFFRNPFRRKWVFSIKSPGNRWGVGREARERTRCYWEGGNFFDFSPSSYGLGEERINHGRLGERLLEAARRDGVWPSDSEVVLWTGADSADPPDPDFNLPPQLYNLDCCAYESLILGFFSIWRGDYFHDSGSREAGRLRELGRPKTNEVFLGFSRDGFHWHRPDRRPFLASQDTAGSWNWGNVQSAGGGCLVVDGRLRFYFSGRSGRALPEYPSHESGGSTGLATLRRDGFASLDAGVSGGELLTRKIRFSGRHLFVNADLAVGELRVGLLDDNGRPIKPFTVENCLPLSAGDTMQRVQWKGAADLSALAGQAVRIRFRLRSGRLYAFWVSSDGSGKSNGYMAAGGPGFPRGRDA